MSRISQDHTPHIEAKEQPRRPAPRSATPAEAGAKLAEPEPAEFAPPVGLAALRDRARMAGRELADQPISIGNHDAHLILKLFGG